MCIRDRGEANTVKKATVLIGLGIKAADKGRDVKRAANAGEVAVKSRKAALREAKISNNIPKSKSPDKVIKPNTIEGEAIGLDKRNVRQYEYTNSNGEKISIREDKPFNYNQGGKGNQGPHFNSGKKGGKLKKHHYYNNK